jgi:hypothetical protein
MMSARIITNILGVNAPTNHNGLFCLPVQMQGYKYTNNFHKIKALNQKAVKI